MEGEIQPEMTNTLKNNELVTGITILAVLRYTHRLNILKCLLIEPLLSYTEVLSALSRKNSSIKSVEDLIIKRSIAFSNFSERYFEKLILSINSIMLFQQMGLLDVKDNQVVYGGKKFNFSDPSLGKIVEKRIKAAEHLATILCKGEASDMYLGLRIRL